MSNTPIPRNLKSTSDTIEAEALAWIAQLSGDDVSEKDLLAFREWAQKSPAHQKEIVELSEFWEGLNILTTMDGPIYEADKVYKKLRDRQKWRKGLVATATIVCGLLLLTLGQFVFTNSYPRSDQPVETAIAFPVVLKSEIGEQQTHTLPDGSTITLNTDSYLEVNYARNQRNIRLVKGEAFFEVAKDNSRPFLVFANNGVIRAVGTEFSVWVQNDYSLDIIVAEGTIELSSLTPKTPGERASASDGRPAQIVSLGMVTAGQSARLNDQKTSIELVSDELIDLKLSWKEGLLKFRGESLEEVIAQVSRYTQLQIGIDDDPELRALRFGGVFKSGETDVLFRTLETQFGIVAKNQNDTSVILVRNK